MNKLPTSVFILLAFVFVCNAAPPRHFVQSQYGGGNQYRRGYYHPQNNVLIQNPHSTKEPEKDHHPHGDVEADEKKKIVDLLQTEMDKLIADTDRLISNMAAIMNADNANLAEAMDSLNDISNKKVLEIYQEYQNLYKKMKSLQPYLKQNIASWTEKLRNSFNKFNSIRLQFRMWVHNLVTEAQKKAEAQEVEKKVNAEKIENLSKENPASLDQQERINEKLNSESLESIAAELGEVNGRVPVPEGFTGEVIGRGFMPLGGIIEEMYW